VAYYQILFCNLNVKKMSDNNTTDTTSNTRRTRSGRIVRRVTRYEPQEIVEDDTSCSDFSMSDDDNDSIPGSYLGDRSDVDEPFEIGSDVEEDDDNSDVEVDDSDEEDDEEEEEDEDVLDWDRLTENASDDESSDEEEF